MKVEVLFREAKHTGAPGSGSYSRFNPGTITIAKGTVIIEEGLPLPYDILS
jgi:hypothetical protein